MSARSAWFWKAMGAVPERDTMQTYLETVAVQIRWKRARSVTIPELEQHLEDQRESLAAFPNSQHSGHIFTIAFAKFTCTLLNSMVKC